MLSGEQKSSYNVKFTFHILRTNHMKKTKKNPLKLNETRFEAEAHKQEDMLNATISATDLS